MSKKLEFEFCLTGSIEVQEPIPPEPIPPEPIPPEPIPPEPTINIEGFGENVTGGKGGPTIVVDNLNDSGPGSLREAIENQTGTRIIVFDSSLCGELVLESNLYIQDDNITLTGYGSPIVIRAKRNFGCRNASNIIFTHLKVRNHKLNSVSADSILAWDSFGVVINHCSLFWATDECIGIANTQEVTVQWCILAESTKVDSQSKPAGAGLLCDNLTSNITLHHNLLVSHIHRNPKLSGQGDETYYDVINNIFYNWGSWATQASNDVKANIINNHYKLGPSNTHYPGIKEILFEGGVVNQREVYLSGNEGPSDLNGNDNWNMCTYFGGIVESDVRTDIPHDTPLINVESVENSINSILDNAGSFPRDNEDQRIVDDYKNGTGQIITEAPY